MGHTTAFRTVTRTGAAACLAAGLALLGGGMAGAAPLPAPVPQSPLQQASGDVTGSLPGALGDVTDQVTGALTGQPGTGSGGGIGTGIGTGGGQGSGSGSATATGGPGPTSPGTGGSGTGGSSGSGPTGSGTSGSTTGGRTATTSDGQPQAGARVTSDPLTACVIPTGGSPAVEFDLSVLGNDAGTPLAEAIPQVFTPCPEGAVPADDLVGVDVDVAGLLGACVRVTREVAPLQTTLVVLDQDVIKALTDAGLPLEQLVVPCPAGARARSATTPTPAAGGADLGRGDRPAASAVPGLPDRLAFTGADTVALASLAAGLLSLGTVLTRQARRLRRSVSRG